MPFDHFILDHLEQALKWVVCHFCRTTASKWTKKKLEKKSSSRKKFDFFGNSHFLPLELFPSSKCLPYTIEISSTDILCFRIVLNTIYTSRLVKSNLSCPSLSLWLIYLSVMMIYLMDCHRFIILHRYSQYIRQASGLKHTIWFFHNIS